MMGSQVEENAETLFTEVYHVHYEDKVNISDKEMIKILAIGIETCTLNCTSLFKGSFVLKK